MRRFLCIFSGGIFLMPLLASAQSVTSLDRQVGSCTEDSPNPPNFMLLVDGAGATKAAGDANIRHDHYLDLSIERDAATGAFGLAAELGTGTVAMQYLDREGSQVRLNSAIEWRGPLSARGNGLFLSQGPSPLGGLNVRLTKRQHEQFHEIDPMIVSLGDMTEYTADVIRPNGEVIHMTCHIQESKLAKVDKAQRAVRAANSSINQAVSAAATEQDRQDPHTVPQAPARAPRTDLDIIHSTVDRPIF